MATATKKGTTKQAAAETVRLGFVIDESGSMGHLVTSVVEGVNEFVSTLVREGADEKDTRCTVAFFDAHGDDERVRVRVDNAKIGEVPELGLGDYNPRGMTPLNDAISTVIQRLDGAMKKKDRSMVVIVTDGQENASETSTEDLRKLVMAKEADGWEFIYLAANVDAFAASQDIGMAAKPGSYMRFSPSPVGTSNMMRRAGGQSAAYTSDSGTYAAMASSTPDFIPEDPAEFEAQQEEIADARAKAEADAKTKQRDGVQSQASGAAKSLFGKE